MKEKLLQIFQKLGFLDKAKQGQLTPEEWLQVENSYKEAFGTELRTDMAEENQPPASSTSLTQEEIASVYSMISPTNNGEGEESQTNNQRPTMNDFAVAIKTVQEQNTNLQQLVENMAGKMADDKPENSVVAVVGLNGPGTTSEHLFGLRHSAFSMKYRWNSIAVDRSVAAKAMTDGVELSFFNEASSFSKSLAKRYQFLNENHMLDANKLASGEFGISTQGVDDAKVGDQYIIRRQDALIARVLQKRDLTQYFPVRYGIQDRDLVFNAFFGELSQAWQEGEVFKGEMKIENEIGYVDDLMIKMKWGPYKELERKYIGYLNKEGSDPIKWSMIEFAILNSLETAQVEQNKRRMRGIYVKPEKGVAGSYLSASTGIIYTLIRYVHENKLLVHDDETYRSYTESTMLDAVKEFVKDVIASCTEDMDIDNHVIYLNKMHKTWWLECIRAKYGKDYDFTGPESYANLVPDTSLRIIWLPYMGQLPLMFMDIPGNIQFLENIPGEMLGIKAKDDMEMVKAWSVWKEGTSASFVGRNCKTLDKLKENNFEWQFIYMNKPAVTVEADATKVDAKKGFWFITSANTEAKAITEITGAKLGVAYIIECGDINKATTVAKADAFENLTAAYTPTQVGDYLMVALGSNGKFRELERCVGGIRTINVDVQPNIPGGR